MDSANWPVIEEIVANSINPNGCGPHTGLNYGKSAITGFLSAAFPSKFQECCKRHDIDYGVCGEDKKYADERFAVCLHEKCDEIIPKEEPGSYYKSCRFLANAAWRSVWSSDLGVDAYIAKQEKNCKCMDKEEQE
jgi:hypothetical protein